MRKKKKSSKISKKRKKFSKEEVDFLLKINSIKLIYLDNALLGYKSDEEEKRICGDDFLNWVKNTKKESLISFINIYELRPLFIGKIIETHSHLAKDILKTLNDFDPLVMGEKETQKLFKKIKNYGII